MYRILMLCMDTAVAALPVIPVFLVLNRYVIQNKKHCLIMAGLTLYFCAVYAVAGLPNITFIRFSPNINLRPFAYMFSDFQNSFLNVLMFIPLGYLIPFCWPYFRKLHRTLILGFLTSLAIEVLQLFTFRASDINDLMTNTLGTLLGWLGMRLFSRYSFLNNNGLSISYLRISLGIALFVMIFLHPFLLVFLHRTL